MASSCKFFARVTVGEDVEYIEVWCHELDPVDRMKQRPSEEWVHEHLSECDRKFFAQLIPEEKRAGNFQVLFNGELSGQHDYYGEWDEDIDIGEVLYQHLPDDWFTNTPDEELPMAQLN